MLRPGGDPLSRRSTALRKYPLGWTAMHCCSLLSEPSGVCVICTYRPAGCIDKESQLYRSNSLTHILTVLQFMQNKGIVSTELHSVKQQSCEEQLFLGNVGYADPPSVLST